MDGNFVIIDIETTGLTPLLIKSSKWGCRLGNKGR